MKTGKRRRIDKNVGYNNILFFIQGYKFKFPKNFPPLEHRRTLQQLHQEPRIHLPRMPPYPPPHRMSMPPLRGSRPWQVPFHGGLQRRRHHLDDVYLPNYDCDESVEDELEEFSHPRHNDIRPPTTRIDVPRSSPHGWTKLSTKSETKDKHKKFTDTSASKSSDKYDNEHVYNKDSEETVSKIKSFNRSIDIASETVSNKNNGSNTTEKVIGKCNIKDSKHANFIITKSEGPKKESSENKLKLKKTADNITGHENSASDSKPKLTSIEKTENKVDSTKTKYSAVTCTKNSDKSSSKFYNGRDSNFTKTYVDGKLEEGSSENKLLKVYDKTPCQERPTADCQAKLSFKEKTKNKVDTTETNDSAQTYQTNVDHSSSLLDKGKGNIKGDTNLYCAKTKLEERLKIESSENKLIKPLDKLAGQEKSSSKSYSYRENSTDNKNSNFIKTKSKECPKTERSVNKLIKLSDRLAFPEKVSGDWKAISTSKEKSENKVGTKKASIPEICQTKNEKGSSKSGNVKGKDHKHSTITKTIHKTPHSQNSADSKEQTDSNKSDAIKFNKCHVPTTPNKCNSNLTLKVEIQNKDKEKLSKKDRNEESTIQDIVDDTGFKNNSAKNESKKRGEKLHLLCQEEKRKAQEILKDNEQKKNREQSNNISNRFTSQDGKNITTKVLMKKEEQHLTNTSVNKEVEASRLEFKIVQNGQAIEEAKQSQEKNESSPEIKCKGKYKEEIEKALENSIEDSNSDIIATPTSTPASPQAIKRHIKIKLIRSPLAKSVLAASKTNENSDLQDSVKNCDTNSNANKDDITSKKCTFEDIKLIEIDKSTALNSKMNHSNNKTNNNNSLVNSSRCSESNSHNLFYNDSGANDSGNKKTENTNSDCDVAILEDIYILEDAIKDIDKSPETIEVPSSPKETTHGKSSRNNLIDCEVSKTCSTKSINQKSLATESLDDAEIIDDHPIVIQIDDAVDSPTGNKVENIKEHDSTSFAPTDNLKVPKEEHIDLTNCRSPSPTNKEVEDTLNQGQFEISVTNLDTRSSFLYTFPMHFDDHTVVDMDISNTPSPSKQMVQEEHIRSEQQLTDTLLQQIDDIFGSTSKDSEKSETNRTEQVKNSNENDFESVNESVTENLIIPQINIDNLIKKCKTILGKGKTQKNSTNVTIPDIDIEGVLVECKRVLEQGNKFLRSAKRYRSKSCEPSTDKSSEYILRKTRSLTDISKVTEVTFFLKKKESPIIPINERVTKQEVWDTFNNINFDKDGVDTTVKNNHSNGEPDSRIINRDEKLSSCKEEELLNEQSILSINDSDDDDISPLENTRDYKDELLSLFGSPEYQNDDLSPETLDKPSLSLESALVSGKILENVAETSSFSNLAINKAICDITTCKTSHSEDEDSDATVDLNAGKKLPSNSDDEVNVKNECLLGREKKSIPHSRTKYSRSKRKEKTSRKRVYEIDDNEGGEKKRKKRKSEEGYDVSICTTEASCSKGSSVQNVSSSKTSSKSTPKYVTKAEYIKKFANKKSPVPDMTLSIEPISSLGKIKKRRGTFTCEADNEKILKKITTCEDSLREKYMNLFGSCSDEDDDEKQKINKCIKQHACEKVEGSNKQTTTKNTFETSNNAGCSTAEANCLNENPVPIPSSSYGNKICSRRASEASRLSEGREVESTSSDSRERINSQSGRKHIKHKLQHGSTSTTKDKDENKRSLGYGKESDAKIAKKKKTEPSRHSHSQIKSSKDRRKSAVPELKNISETTVNSTAEVCVRTPPKKITDAVDAMKLAVEKVVTKDKSKDKNDIAEDIHPKKIKGKRNSKRKTSTTNVNDIMENPEETCIATPPRKLKETFDIVALQVEKVKNSKDRGLEKKIRKLDKDDRRNSAPGSFTKHCSVGKNDNGNKKRPNDHIECASKNYEHIPRSSLQIIEESKMLELTKDASKETQVNQVIPQIYPVAKQEHQALVIKSVKKLTQIDRRFSAPDILNSPSISDQPTNFPLLYRASENEDNIELDQCQSCKLFMPKFERITRCSIVENECTDTVYVIEPPEVCTDIQKVKNDDDVIEIQPYIPMIDLTDEDENRRRENRQEEQSTDLLQETKRELEELIQVQGPVTLYRSEDTDNAQEETQIMSDSVTLGSRSKIVEGIKLDKQIQVPNNDATATSSSNISPRVTSSTEISKGDLNPAATAAEMFNDLVTELVLDSNIPAATHESDPPNTGVNTPTHTISETLQGVPNEKLDVQQVEEHPTLEIESNKVVSDNLQFLQNEGSGDALSNPAHVHEHLDNNLLEKIIVQHSSIVNLDHKASTSVKSTAVIEPRREENQSNIHTSIKTLNNRQSDQNQRSTLSAPNISDRRPRIIVRPTRAQSLVENTNIETDLTHRLQTAQNQIAQQVDQSVGQHRGLPQTLWECRPQRTVKVKETFMPPPLIKRNNNKSQISISNSPNTVSPQRTENSADVIDLTDNQELSIFDVAIIIEIFTKHVYFLANLRKAQHCYMTYLDSLPHYMTYFKAELKLFHDDKDRRLLLESEKLLMEIQALNIRANKNLKASACSIIRSVYENLVQKGMASLSKQTVYLLVNALLKPQAQRITCIPLIKAIIRLCNEVYARCYSRIYQTSLSVNQLNQLTQQVNEYRRLFGRQSVPPSQSQVATASLPPVGQQVDHYQQQSNATGHSVLQARAEKQQQVQISRASGGLSWSRPMDLPRSPIVTMASGSSASFQRNHSVQANQPNIRAMSTQRSGEVGQITDNVGPPSQLNRNFTNKNNPINQYAGGPNTIALGSTPRYLPNNEISNQRHVYAPGLNRSLSALGLSAKKQCQNSSIQIVTPISAQLPPPLSRHSVIDKSLPSYHNNSQPVGPPKYPSNVSAGIDISGNISNEFVIAQSPIHPNTAMTPTQAPQASPNSNNSLLSRMLSNENASPRFEGSRSLRQPPSYEESVGRSFRQPPNSIASSSQSCDTDLKTRNENLLNEILAASDKGSIFTNSASKSTTNENFRIKLPFTRPNVSTTTTCTTSDSRTALNTTVNISTQSTNQITVVSSADISIIPPMTTNSVTVANPTNQQNPAFLARNSSVVTSNNSTFLFPSPITTNQAVTQNIHQQQSLLGNSSATNQNCSIVLPQCAAQNYTQGPILMVNNSLSDTTYMMAQPQTVSSTILNQGLASLSSIGNASAMLNLSPTLVLGHSQQPSIQLGIAQATQQTSQNQLVLLNNQPSASTNQSTTYYLSTSSQSQGSTFILGNTAPQTNSGPTLILGASTPNPVSPVRPTQSPTIYVGLPTSMQNPVRPTHSPTIISSASTRSKSLDSSSNKKIKKTNVKSSSGKTKKTSKKRGRPTKKGENLSKSISKRTICEEVVEIQCSSDEEMPLETKESRADQADQDTKEDETTITETYNNHLVDVETEVLPNNEPQPSTSVTEENSPEDDIETVDLTWIDELDEEQLEKDFQFVFVKKEELVTEGEQQENHNIVVPSPADSGINSPPCQNEEDTTVYTVNVERLCICSNTAQYNCVCGEAWYCGKECQLNDWEVHQKVCQIASEVEEELAPNTEEETLLT